MTMPDTDSNTRREQGGAATLIFPRGAANLHVRSGGSEGLVTGSFTGDQPEITSAGSTVFVRFPRRSNRTEGELRLRSDVEWTIQSGRGIEGSTVDLTGLELGALRIGGGASRLWLNLPRPGRRVHIEIDKGVDRVSIVRPPEAGAILQIEHGASNLVFDSQSFRAVSGGIRLETPAVDPSAGSYQITIRSGANRLSVVTSERAVAAHG